MVREFDKMDLNFNNLKKPKGDNFLEDEEDEKNYEELHRLYTTNYLIIKEFALHIVEHIIFYQGASDENQLVFKKKRPSISNSFILANGKKSLTQEQFKDLMASERVEFVLVNPQQLRMKFT